MLCSRFLRDGKADTHGFFYRAMEGVFDCMLHVYGVTLRWVLRHRPVMLAMFVAVLVVTAVPLRGRAQGLHSGYRQRQFLASTWKPRRAPPTTRWSSTRSWFRPSWCRIRTSRASTPATGGSIFGPAGATGRMMVNLSPRRQRKATVAEIVNRTAPQTRRHSRTARLPLRSRRPSASADACPRAPTITPCTVRTPQQLYAEAPKLERVIARLPGLQDVTSDLQIKTPRVNIVLDRDRAAALHLNWNTISSTLYDAFGPQFSSTIYAPTNQYRVLLEMLPKYQQHTDGLDMIYLKSDTGEHGSARAPWPSWWPMPARRAFRTPASCPRSPSPSRSSPARRSARPPTRLKTPPKPLCRPPSPATFQGTAKVFQDSMQQHGHPADRGHRGGLHRARRAVRKLRPPAHHPLRPALGRLRRAAHPDPLQGGSQHLFLRRPDHADRHREEERHHADRFRPGSRAQGRHDAARSHLRRLPDPLPPHHDDHHGGAARRLADRARLRRRRRSAPAARPGGGRRPGIFAVDDLIPDPGGLYLYGGNSRQVERLEGP